MHDILSTTGPRLGGVFQRTVALANVATEEESRCASDMSPDDVES